MSVPKILAVLSLGLTLLAGCGAHCDDSAMRASYINECTQQRNGTAGQCACTWAFVADRYSCEDIQNSNINFADLQAGAAACGY